MSERSASGLPSSGGAESTTVTRPTNHDELVSLVEEALIEWDLRYEKYAHGRFAVVMEELEVAVICDERTFPAIRFNHRVGRIEDDRRMDVIQFANSLHGRTSTLGSHWWLGDEQLWQVSDFFAWTFIPQFLIENLTIFAEVAHERSPEMQARFIDLSV